MGSIFINTLQGRFINGITLQKNICININIKVYIYIYIYL